MVMKRHAEGVAGHRHAIREEVYYRDAPASKIFQPCKMLLRGWVHRVQLRDRVGRVLGRTLSQWR